MNDQFRNPHSAIRIQIPATTANLGPGFDCLGMALSLYNEIEIEMLQADDNPPLMPLDYRPAGAYEIFIDGEGSIELPRDVGNLIARSMQRVFDQINFEHHGLRIRSINRIPLMGGLGSSSAAIVGGLIAANELSGNQLTHTELLTLAIEIEGHPDNVAPALFGGLVIVASDQRGPIVSQVEVPEMKVVLVTPNLRVSTEEARRLIPKTILHSDAVFNAGRVALVAQALSSGDYDLLGRAMDDRLHQPFRKHLITGYDEVMGAAKSAGASAMAISGSGPSLIAFAPDRHAVIAKAMQAAFKQHGVESRAWILEVDRAGAGVIARSAQRDEAISVDNH
jgi:homoserine kinase